MHFHLATRSLSLSFIIAAATWAVADTSPATQATSSGDTFVFSYFKGNGEDGLHLAWSRDGYTWKALKDDKPFLTPGLGKEKLMRDPCVQQDKAGAFHMVWTVGWKDPTIIGYANSKDLIHWSEQRALPALPEEPTARNAWAPELFFDEPNNQFLIFWATTIPGRFPENDTSGANSLNHRIYYRSTKDFQALSPVKLLFEPGFSVIDATILRAGGKYHLIFKDETETPVKKNLRIATSDRPEGPYGNVTGPISIDWVEGPSAIRIGGAHLIYFDHYRKPQYYGAIRSTDLMHFDDVSQQVSFPPGTRHGTAFRVSENVLAGLLAEK